MPMFWTVFVCILVTLFPATTGYLGITYSHKDCTASPPDELCQDGRDSRLPLFRYYFSETLKTCLPFLYYQCPESTSLNVFPSIKECLRTCKSHSHKKNTTEVIN